MSCGATAKTAWIWSEWRQSKNAVNIHKENSTNPSLKSLND